MGKNQPFHNSGIALLMTLWVLVFLSFIAMNFSFSTRWGAASIRNLKDETKAYYLAVSAYQDVLAYLLSNKDSLIVIDGEGNLYTDKETKPLITGKQVTDEAEIDVRVTDEEAKVNINLAGPVRLKMLFDYIGMPADAVQEVIDSILDWIDPDKDHHLSGAESEYYEGLNPPYKAKNLPLNSIEELLLIKGFKPEYLYGTDEIKSLYNLTTVTGDGAININTAPKEIMEMIGMNQVDIDMALRQRSKEFGGFKAMPNFTVTPGFGLKLTSNYFRIEVTAKLKDSRQATKITAIVKKNAQSETESGFQTVYWRETVETRRS